MPVKEPIMKIPRALTEVSLNDVPKREITVPALLFAGAAGSLALGAYALVNHLRSDRSTSILKIAAIGAPVLMSGGLAYLGYRDWRGDRALLNGAVERAQEWIGDNTTAVSSRRGRPRKTRLAKSS
jgi:hypothetical protein